MLQYLLFLWMGVGLFGTFTAGKHTWGWLVMILFNLGWMAYAFSIGEYALATQNILFGIIATRNYLVNKPANLQVSNHPVID